MRSRIMKQADLEKFAEQDSAIFYTGHTTFDAFRNAARHRGEVEPGDREG
jgi:BioD-like phosphotransacetylase family protein